MDLLLFDLDGNYSDKRIVSKKRCRILFRSLLIACYISASCTKEERLIKKKDNISCPAPVADYTYLIVSIQSAANQSEKIRHIAKVVIDFNASGNSQNRYSWNFGDGDTSSFQQIVHAYYIGEALDMGDGKHWALKGDTVKTFSATLKVFNCYGQTASVTQSFTIVVNMSQLYAAAAKYYWSP